MRRTRSLTAVTTVLGTALTATLAIAPATSALGQAPPGEGSTQVHCARSDGLAVPGAEKQVVACLDDLTTASTALTGHTVPADYKGLTSVQTRNPSGVPGIQVDGYFPDTSTTNANNGWHHDAQYVLRLPDHWNGGLVVGGAPGVRGQYALDEAISDWVLARGYAFAATDKGNTGAQFYRDGVRPGDAIVEWNDRVTQLTRAAQAVVKQRYGSPARRTYAAGLSNGGYLVRWQLENHPELYDGGVDWEGTLFTAEGPNLFTYLPTALREYPKWRAGDAAAGQRMIAAGFSPGSEFLWDFHYGYYWDLTQRIYREEFDPTYDGATEAGTPFCQSGTPQCDADYDYASRPQAVKDAVARVSLTGRIGKPMLTLHGTLDSLLPRETDSDVYSRMVDQAGAGALHRYYVVQDGNHVDGLYDAFPTRLRPILPCFREAFTQLEGWTQQHREPSPSGVVTDPGSGDVANTCTLPSTGG